MIRAVLDADVLYGLPLRDTLLSLAQVRLFRPVWSNAILDEAIRNLLADNRLDAAGADRLRSALATHFEEAFAQCDDALIARMSNHPKDRHVAACAVAGEASLIVTSNISDFQVLPEGVQAVSPDMFLLMLWKTSRSAFNSALEAQSRRLVRSPMSIADIIDRLEPVAPTFSKAWHEPWRRLAIALRPISQP